MIDYLHWRYATKKFDPARKVPEKEFAQLLETLRLSPSSFGLQPWRFIVVRDEKLRRQLRPHVWNQPQVTDASHFIVFCALRKMDADYVRSYVKRIARERTVAPGSLSSYEQMMLGFLKGRTPAEISHWMKLQVYLALGMFLSECARRKIDACPMEGFEPEKVDGLLGLPKEGLEAVVLCAVGYRAKDDAFAALKKVRFDKHEIFIEK
ncbi:MAG: NAD(P)H-dependent oxidoreductase [Candidatus Omnitrophica bacterium]|nr:NAD(P)H-dependent oxidoreductase [Candidatus Omnitrophota bacterium]